MDRTKILRKHLSLGLLYKFSSIAILYITTPILLNFLGSENYGIWVTIFALINWFLYVDVGIGNGLKNHLSIALTTNNKKLAREYISTAYFIIFFIALILFTALYFIINSFEIAKFLNLEIKENYIKSIFYINLLFITLCFVLNLFKPLFYSVQKSSIIQLSAFFFQLTVLIQIILCKYFFSNSILSIAIIFGWTNILVSSIFTVFFFLKNKSLIPSYKYFKIERIREILGTGLDFFVIQLCLIFILTTDSLIITKFIGPEKVSVYDIVFKIFQVFLTSSTIILTPLWVLYTDAFLKKDIRWIKKTLKKMNQLFIVLVLFLFLTVCFFDFIVNLWIGRTLDYSYELIVLMACFVLVRVYADIYIYFLNGIGKVKIQKYLYIFGAVINIPLSYIFINYYDMGSSGAILATVLSMISFTFIMPLQVRSILKKAETDGS